MFSHSLIQLEIIMQLNRCIIISTTLIKSRNQQDT